MHLNIVAFKSYALCGNLVPRILPGFQMLHTYKTLKNYEMEPACMGMRLRGYYLLLAMAIVSMDSVLPW